MQSNYDVICFGEILFDLLESGPRPGGAPMNVCFHLNQLGLQSTLISRLADDSYGHQLLTFLSDHNIPNQFVQTDADHPTGTVIVDLDAEGIAHYDIVAPVAWDFISPDDHMLEIVRTTPIFIYGSLAARHAVSRDCLMQCLGRATYKVMDVNLRAPHYSKDVLLDLISKASLLKLNEEELDILTDTRQGDRSIDEKIGLVAWQYNLERIVVTLGGSGAVYFESGQFYHQEAFKVDVSDTVGSGDGFLAAFLHSMHQGRMPQDCLRMACAYGALVASHTGATPLISTQSILNMISSHHE